MESLSLLIGTLNYFYFKAHQQYLLYPEIWFPDDTQGIAFTQSANITAYLAAIICSAIYFVYLLIQRFKVAEASRL